MVQGILTECLLPEAGLYKLDNSILLYMHDRSCLDGGCGLRRGALVELYNVHALKLPSHLLVCLPACLYTKVKIVNFTGTFFAVLVFMST